MKSEMQKRIEQTRKEAEYDAECKRLLSLKPVLAMILKHCTTEFKDISLTDIENKCIEGTPKVGIVGVDVDETNTSPADTNETTPGVISGLNTEDITITEGKITYDIRFYAIVPGTKETIKLIVNIEAQRSSNPGYPLLKRAVYYLSRMISAQKGTVFTGEEYDKICKVYSIWICTRPNKKDRSTVTQYSIKETNRIGNIHENEKNYDLMTAVMVQLGGSEPEQGDICRYLDVLFTKSTKEIKNILKDEFDLDIDESLERVTNNMCNLSMNIREDGIAIGMEQGLQKGMLQGKRDMALEMYSKGISAEEIAKFAKMDVKIVYSWINSSKNDSNK